MILEIRIFEGTNEDPRISKFYTSLESRIDNFSDLLVDGRFLCVPYRSLLQKILDFVSYYSIFVNSWQLVFFSKLWLEYSIDSKISMTKWKVVILHRHRAKIFVIKTSLRCPKLVFFMKNLKFPFQNLTIFILFDRNFNSKFN